MRKRHRELGELQIVPKTLPSARKAEIRLCRRFALDRILLVINWQETILLRTEAEWVFTNRDKLVLGEIRRDMRRLLTSSYETNGSGLILLPLCMMAIATLELTNLSILSAAYIASNSVRKDIRRGNFYCGQPLSCLVLSVVTVGTLIWSTRETIDSCRSS